MSRSRLLVFIAVLLSGCAAGRQVAFDRTTAVDTESCRVVTLIDLLATGRGSLIVGNAVDAAR